MTPDFHWTDWTFWGYLLWLNALGWIITVKLLDEKKRNEKTEN